METDHTIKTLLGCLLTSGFWATFSYAPIASVENCVALMYIGLIVLSIGLIIWCVKQDLD